MNNSNETIVYGWKFLNAMGATEGRDMPGAYHQRGQKAATYYNLPRGDQKWGDWLVHPEPIFDGDDYGPGRFHIMRKIGADYAPAGWWLWFARGRGVCGGDYQKAGVAAIQLRRVRPEVFARMIRFGWCCGANLRGANLGGADLHGANHINYAYGVSDDILSSWKLAHNIV